MRPSGRRFGTFSKSLAPPIGAGSAGQRGRSGTRMADDGADVFVAFEGGTGTADMIRRAEAAGIRRWRAP